MRLALLCQVISPWARAAARTIQKMGVEVHVIDFVAEAQTLSYLSTSEKDIGEAITSLRQEVTAVHLIDPGLRGHGKYVFGASELRDICMTVSADYLLSLWGGGMALMCYLSKWRPYGVYLGGGDVLRIANTKLARLLTVHALKSASLVVANGKYLSESARAAFGVDVKSLYYGVDIHRFQPLPYGSGMCRLLCTRGFEPVYNNLAIVNAAAMIPELLERSELRFTGSGSQLMDAKLSARRLMTSSYESGRIVFESGISDDAMLAVLQKSDIYISMSRYDGTSISLLEALSCGLYPILSDIPQNREWINSRRALGTLVPLDDDRGLAGAIAMAIKDIHAREKARVVNRESATRLADSTQNMAVLMEWIKRAISR